MAKDGDKARSEDQVDDHGSADSNQTPLKDVSNAATSPKLGRLESKADQGLIPHATTSGTNIVEGIIETGKTVAGKVEAAMDDGVAWLEKKTREINVDGGVGPYASPGTCLNSDLDVIGTGLLPALTRAEDARKFEENPKDGCKTSVASKEPDRESKRKDSDDSGDKTGEEK